MKKPKRQWRLECNRCGFTLGFGEASKPDCPECGENMHIHSYPEPEKPDTSGQDFLMRMATIL
jgi:rRNA maturation endonuclease Nob1